MRRPWTVVLSVVLQAANLVCTAISYVFDTQKALFATGLEILLLVVVILFWAVIGFFVFYGRNWARIVLAIGLVLQLGGAVVDAVSGTFSYYWSDYLGCVMSALAVILLWLPVSRPFFAKPVARRIDFE
jgi:hypothetical protein